MSALDDYYPVLIGSIFAFASAFSILVIGRHMNVFDKTRQQSTLTTVNIGNVQEELKEMKRMHEDLKDFFDRKFEKAEEERKAEFRRAFEKIEAIAQETYNIGWRVRELEGRANRAPGGSGVVGIL